MSYVLIVSFTWGILLEGPVKFTSYEQCMYHAKKIETLRLRHSMGRPPITASCKKEEST